MPQENQVLRCYSCLAFQVHLVKKQKKWQCKICNSKQSVKQVYGKGSGKDCRLHVIKLNELQFSDHSTNDCDIKDVNEIEVQDCEPATETFTVKDIKSESKWSQYMSKADEISDEEEEEEEEEVKYNMMANECFNKKKRKLNKHVAYASGNEMSFELTQKHKYQSYVETQSEKNKKHVEESKKYGMTFYEGCSTVSGSKWSAFIDREQCLSDEECESGTEAIFMNKTELCQNRSDALLNEESLHTEKLQTGRDGETSPTYNKYLVNTHFEENPMSNVNEKERPGNLRILETLNDDDDLDEILNI